MYNARMCSSQTLRCCYYSSNNYIQTNILVDCIGLTAHVEYGSMKFAIHNMSSSSIKQTISDLVVVIMMQSVLACSCSSSINLQYNFGRVLISSNHF